MDSYIAEYYIFETCTDCTANLSTRIECFELRENGNKKLSLNDYRENGS